MLSDLKGAIRSLRRTPRFTVTAVAALALGIGAAATVASIAWQVLIQPLPYRDADRLVSLYESRPRQGRVRNVVSSPDFLDWRSQVQLFEGLTAVTGAGFNYAGDDGPELIVGAQGDADVFRVLGVNTQLGRTFLPGEDRPGRPPVVVLTHGFWQRRRGGDPSIVGKTLQLSGTVYEVIGVLPDIAPPIRARAEVWVPLVLSGAESRSQHFLDVYGRLKNGVTLEQARTEMDTIAARLEKHYPEANTGHFVNVFPLHEEVVGSARTSLTVLLGAVGFLLLIACANVANLLLAQMTARRREIAVRRALGAGSVHLVRQFLAESLVLALCGGALGSLIAVWSIALVSWAEPNNLPRLAEMRTDWTVIALAFAISLITVILFGLAPAVFAARSNVSSALKSEERGANRFMRDRFKASLASGEIAVALMLVIGAGLLFRSFVRIQSADPGFRTSNTLTVDLPLIGSSYDKAHAVRQFFETLVDKAERIPGVISVSATNALPLSRMDSGYSFKIEGRPAAIRAELPNTRYRVVTPTYFQSAGIAIQGGRAFEARDRDGAPGVVIINESLARQYWPDENAIGKRISLALREDKWHEVVGIVADVKHYGVTQASRGEMYFPFAQSPERFMTVMIRTAAGPDAAVISAFRRAVAGIDPQQPVAQVRTWDEYVTESFGLRKFYTALVAAFSFIALAMSALGIYGVISFAVGLRTREIGIRMALGARAGTVLWMIIRQALMLAGIGIAAGLALSLSLSHTLRGLLFGVPPADALTFFSVAGLLALVAVVASYLPARRAASLDPASVLRAE